MKKFVFLGLLALIGIGFFSYKITLALFSDTTQSTSNTFTASEFFPTPTPVLANHLVISEIQIATSGSTTSDFIELYNPTSSLIDLNGIRLARRARNAITDTLIKSFTTSTIVSAHGYFLWAASDGGYANQIGADTSTSVNIANNSSVALKVTSTDEVIDAVAWGSGHAVPLTESAAFVSNPSVGQSLERKALSTSDATSMTSGTDVSKGNGFDANNNSTDFILRAISQPQNTSSATESP